MSVPFLPCWLKPGRTSGNLVMHTPDGLVFAVSCENEPIPVVLDRLHKLIALVEQHLGEPEPKVKAQSGADPLPVAPQVQETVQEASKSAFVMYEAEDASDKPSCSTCGSEKTLKPSGRWMCDPCMREHGKRRWTSQDAAHSAPQPASVDAPPQMTVPEPMAGTEKVARIDAAISAAKEIKVCDWTGCEGGNIRRPDGTWGLCRRCDGTGFLGTPTQRLKMAAAVRRSTVAELDEAVY